MNKQIFTTPKIIIGLGNPGAAYENTRHNIGFKILDQLAEQYNASWKEKNNFLMAAIIINNQPIALIKPLTFMNSSGKVIPHNVKQGIDADQILVVHDELEFPFGKIAFKLGGSARGHNGLKSLIEFIKGDFLRLRFGIGRPDDKSLVPDYVLSKFSENKDNIADAIYKAIELIEKLF